MRKLAFLIIFLSASFGSTAADLYTSVKSSLSESITDDFNIQLIDANIAGHYVLIKASAEVDISDEFQGVARSLTKSGFQQSYNKDLTYHQLLVKAPRDSLDGVLQLFFQKVSNKKLRSLEFIIIGSINQQRLLGLVNRQFNASGIAFDSTVNLPENDSVISLPALDTESGVDTPHAGDWMVRLSAALINCNYLSQTYVSFNYNQEKFFCNQYAPNHSITDKEVANFKDGLYSSIQLSIESPEGFLNYIASFNSERRLELSQAYFNTLPSLSIDSILEYHYKQILNVEIEPSLSVASAKQTVSYQLPNNFKVKSNFIDANSKVVNFTIAIDSTYTCVQLNCSSLASLPYIDYTYSGNLHLFSIQYPAANETSIIGELNKVLFIPLSTSNRIAQEDILITLQGGYLLEAYDESFSLLAKLPLVNSNLKSMSQQQPNGDKLRFYTNRNNQNLVTMNLTSVPGSSFWEESELYYFILANRLKDMDDSIVFNKANTLVNFSLPASFHLNKAASPIQIDFPFTEEDRLQDIIANLLKQIGDLPNKLSRDQFVEYKRGVITNIQLLENNSQVIRQLSQAYDLENPSQMLLARLESLSYEQFQSYLKRNLAYSTISISTHYELEESLHESLKQIFSDSH